MAEQYKNVIIGSGEAGKYLAWAQARLGERTIVVERALLGGACPNVACLPSKNVIHSAKVASLVAHAARYGVIIAESKVDMAGVLRRKQEMVDVQREVHKKLFADSGAEVLMGHAQFTEPKTVEVALLEGGTRELRGERIFLGVGSRALVPNLPGLAEARPMTHVEALDLNRLPAHLVILGGGYVGLEFAQALRRFGSQVTVVQRGAQLLEREDPEFADAILRILQDEGIEVLLKTELASVAGRSGESLRLEVRLAGAARTIEASDLLVAAGRAPNTERLGVERVGVTLDPRGYIRVNEGLETTAPGVWAMGDCAGSPQFTHASFDDFRIVRDNLAGGARTTRDRLIPYCLFTDPELAHIGLTENAARSQGIHYRLLKLPMAAILRTRTHGDPRGMLKALIGDDDRILGFTALGSKRANYWPRCKSQWSDVCRTPHFAKACLLTQPRPKVLRRCLGLRRLRRSSDQKIVGPASRASGQMRGTACMISALAGRLWSLTSCLRRSWRRLHLVHERCRQTTLESIWKVPRSAWRAGWSTSWAAPGWSNFLDAQAIDLSGRRGWTCLGILRAVLRIRRLRLDCLGDHMLVAWINNAGQYTE